MLPSSGIGAIMKRRDFIQAIAGAAAGWPFAVRAQQPVKWRVGFLHPGSSQSAVPASRIAAFREGLAPRGAGDVEVVGSFAEDRLDRLPGLAAELVKQGVQAICASAPPAVRAAQQATSSVPIVAVDLESDPIASGWAMSLAHPGKNVTGIFLDLPGFSAKMLQLLREAVPGLAKVAALWHPAGGPLQLEAVRGAASALNVTVEVFEVNGPSDLEGVFQAMAKSQTAGVVMLSSPLFAGNPRLLADLALQSRLPAISIFPNFAQGGGLIAYGPELEDLFRQAGIMTRKMLQGAAVADLPIERPTRFKLVANLKTGKALGLTMPTSILLSADEVIE
jgi:putative ABC transport system substrate-binding protein